MRVPRIGAGLPRTVVVLGFVSLLNDAASEMITPLLPLFLTAILGAGPAVVGLVEGVAEATASVLKLASGRWLDRGARARSLVLAGYGCSNVARPLIGLALSWPFVLLLRFADRVGKGVRTAPRDAMIAAAADPERRGRAFGFHRSMDHAGAVVGPLFAYLLLARDWPLASVFLASILPGVLLLALLAFGLRRDVPAMTSAPPPMTWRGLDPELRRMIVAAGVLSLATVPEVLVILHVSESHVGARNVALSWAAASALKMLIAWPAGYLADRAGTIPVLLAGWSARIGVLVAFALLDPAGTGAIVLFCSYALTLASTEAAERSLVGARTAPSSRGTSYGVYHLVTGIAALPGAALFGVLWQAYSAHLAFAVAAILSTLGSSALLAATRRSR
jgi:MFS family permease